MKLFNNRKSSEFNLREPRVRINVPKRRQYLKLVINNLFQRPFRYFIRSVYTIINKLRNEDIPPRTTVSQELSYRTEESFNPEVELANFSNLNIREVIKIGDAPPAIAGPSNFELRDIHHHLQKPRQIPSPIEFEDEPDENSFLSYMNRMRHVARWVATTVNSPWTYDEFTEPVKHVSTCDCCLLLSYGNFIPSEAGAEDHFPCC